MTALLTPFIDQILTKTDGDASSVRATSMTALSKRTTWTGRQMTFLSRLAQTGEGEMARNRLLISALIFLYLFAETLLNARVLTIPLFVITAFFLFSLVLALHINAHPEANHRRRILALCGDVGTLSVGLHIGTEICAVTFPIYLWIIFSNAFRFGLFFLTLSSLTAAASFALVILTTSYWQSFYNLSFGLLMALVVLPLYARHHIRDLSEARRRAETANEMKTLFLASVSHELRTPLNAIIGLSDLLSSTKLDEEQREMLTSINASGRSLCGLIDNFLDYSRLEAGAMPTSKTPFCLVSLLTELNSIARTRAHGKAVAINLHVTPQTPTALIGDQGKLAQVLTNLLTNAVKFTERGTVSLAIDAQPQEANITRLRFEVSDTGIGISKAAQEKIFQRFTQADARIVDQYGGTGLGLAIVQELVELLGGKFGLTSQPGVGSTFWCEFDIAVDHALDNRPQLQNLNVAVFAKDDTLRGTFADATGFDCVQMLEDEQQLTLWLDERRDKPTVSALIVDESLYHLATHRTRADPFPNLKVITVTKRSDLDFSQNRLKAETYSCVKLPTVEKDLTAALKCLAIHQDCRQKETDSTSTKNACALSVLVAEDNRANQMVVQKILSHAGHTAHVVNDGKEALEALEKQEFNVILLDLNMPRMNGFEALKSMHILLREKNVPIIALTADASDATNKKCHKAGFDACITKPYNASTLQMAILSLTKNAKPASRDLDQVSPAQHSERSKDHDPLLGVGQSCEIKQNGDTNYVIDLDRVRRLAKLGDTSFFHELINEFDSEALNILSNLRVATDSRDVKKIRLLAHALKSSATNFGATRLVQTCERLEYGERQDTLKVAISAVATLRTDYEAVRAALVALAAPNADTGGAAIDKATH